MAALDRLLPGSGVSIRIRKTADGQQWVDPRELSANIFGNRELTLGEQTRRYFGAELTPETIESVIRAAEFGYMRDLTDLEKETINVDPHLSAVVGKRFRALASIEPKVVVPEDVKDAEVAGQYADQLRSMLRRIPNIRRQIIRLTWAHCTGRSCLEKVWRERTGDYKWDIAELNWIHARRQCFGPRREIRIRDDVWSGQGFEARGLAVDEYPHKFLWYLPQLFDEYPEREGFGPRALYWSFFKRWGQRDRMILLELFGKPWKIVHTDQAATSSPQQLDDAQSRADELGSSSSAALGPGLKLEIVNPDPKSTEGHRLNTQDCNDEISKLVLGQTRTTDAKADGLGGQQALVHQDGETLVIAADGWELSDTLTEGFSYDWVALNYGEDELVNAPRIELKYELPPDPDVEIERTSKVLGFGLPMKIDEVYERSGFSRPEPGDEVVTQESAPATPGLPGGGGGARIGVEPGEGAVEPDIEEGGEDSLAPLAAASARHLRLSRLPKSTFLRLSSPKNAGGTTSAAPSSRGQNTAPQTTSSRRPSKTGPESSSGGLTN